MASRPVEQMTDPKRRKQIKLPMAWVSLSVAVAACALMWWGWDSVSCTGELEEATSSLTRIYDLEQAYETKNGHYVGMAPCNFTEGGAVCVSRLGFSIVGNSHFSYRVDSDGETFTASAVGAGGRHFGSVLRVNDEGDFDLGGAQCRK